MSDYLRKLLDKGGSFRVRYYSYEDRMWHLRTGFSRDQVEAIIGDFTNTRVYVEKE